MTPDTVVTVLGDYTAASDLMLDVILGGDTSASDRLVITGATSGVTNVYVMNRGGTGAQTTNGILVVDVEGASGWARSAAGRTTDPAPSAFMASPT